MDNFAYSEKPPKSSATGEAGLNRSVTLAPVRRSSGRQYFGCVADIEKKGFVKVSQTRRLQPGLAALQLCVAAP